MEAKDEQLAAKAMIAKKPLGVPWIDPADVVPMVVFLASDAARMASGVLIQIRPAVASGAVMISPG